MRKGRHCAPKNDKGRVKGEKLIQPQQLKDCYDDEEVEILDPPKNTRSDDAQDK